MDRNHLPRVHCLLPREGVYAEQAYPPHHGQLELHGDGRQNLPEAASRDPASLRPRPHQDPDEAHQPREGARRRPGFRADQLGRGVRHHRRQAHGAQEEWRNEEARLPKGPLHRCRRRPLQEVQHPVRHPELLRSRRHLRRSREDGELGDRRYLLVPQLRPYQHEVLPYVVDRPHLVESHVRLGIERVGQGHGRREDLRDRPAPVRDRREGRQVAADHPRHRRRAGLCDRARHPDEGSLEQEVRGRLQAGAVELRAHRQLQQQDEPVQGRRDRRRVQVRVQPGLRPCALVEPSAQGRHPRVGCRHLRHRGEGYYRGCHAVRQVR